jgi:hypothetical protein
MRNNGKMAADWRRYMSYFIAERFDICLEALQTKGYLTCGVLKSNEEFSGNFWWSKSSHIKKLPKIVDHYYNTPEFLVSSIDGIYKSLWHSEINHFLHPYPATLYENKIHMQTMEKKDGNIVTT